MIFTYGSYKDCVDEWKRAVHHDELLAEERVITANNIGAFYNYVYRRTTNHCGIGVIMDKNGSPITNDQAKANAFNDYFSSVGIIDNDVIPHCSDVTLCSVLDRPSIEVTETDVMLSISRLKTNSSCGPDGLPPVLFKRLKYCLPLALIYNQLMSVGIT